MYKTCEGINLIITCKLMRNKRIKAIVSLVLLLVVNNLRADNNMFACLLCDHLANPIGVDGPPRFSWKINDSAENHLDLSYRVIISEDFSKIARGIGDVWESKKFKAPTNLITYSGKNLRPKTRYYWNIVSDDGKRFLASRETPYFETGKIGEKWHGEWISDGRDTTIQPAPYFRKEFSVLEKPLRARLYIATAGLSEVSINGKAISDDVLSPEFTRFDKRCVYVSYDIGESLRIGENVIGVILGNGWYNFQSKGVWDFENAPWRDRPAFCLELEIVYPDGIKTEICSGDDWKTTLGPIMFNSIYTGEHYDAREEMYGWNLPGFNDASWVPSVVREAPSEVVNSRMWTPIRNIGEYPCSEYYKINDSVYVYGFPENMAGVTRLSVSGEIGTKIWVKHGETLNKERRVDQSTINIYSDEKGGLDPFQTDVYILSGNGVETFMPRFNYKGFQYAEVRADRPIKLNSDNLVAVRMNSDVTPIGSIESSCDILNNIWKAANRSYISNLMGYPTDCPQREKNGWTGDGHIALEAGLYNFDAISVYEKWMADHRDAQLDDGTLPAIIPTGGWGFTFGNGVDWTSSMIIIPWTVYLYYGDERILSDNYDSMRRYLELVKSKSSGNLIDWGLGDWNKYYTVADKELMISIFYYQDAAILSKIASLLGKKKDFKEYGKLASEIKKAINDKFLDKEKAIYATGSQSELSAPLYYGIVPDEYRQLVADNLSKRVISDKKHLDVGLLGSKTILGALSDNGYADLAFEIATQRTLPSWGWWIENGATTLYESWEIDTPTISKNHIMFGEISAWLYKTLGGIKVDENGPGFHSFAIQPCFVEKLDSFKAEYDSVNGKIISSWKRDNGKVMYDLTIPMNGEAMVKFDSGYQVTNLNKGGESLYKPFVNGSIMGAGKYQFELTPIYE